MRDHYRSTLKAQQRQESGGGQTGGSLHLPEWPELQCGWYLRPPPLAVLSEDPGIPRSSQVRGDAAVRTYRGESCRPLCLGWDGSLQLHLQGRSDWRPSGDLLLQTWGQWLNMQRCRRRIKKDTIYWIGIFFNQKSPFCGNSPTFTLAQPKDLLIICGEFSSDVEILSKSHEPEQVFHISRITNHPNYQATRVTIYIIMQYGYFVWTNSN